MQNADCYKDRAVIESMAWGIRLLRFKSWPHHLLAVSLCKSHTVSGLHVFSSVNKDRTSPTS